MTEHVSRHELEQVIASESSHGGRAATRRELQAQSHVLGCDVCTTRKRSIETARSRLLALAPADAFARATIARAADAPPQLPQRPTWPVRATVLALIGAAVALVAAALLWIRFHQP